MESVDEIWLPVKVNAAYEVSSLGRIRSLPRVVRSRGGSTRLDKGRILRGAVTSDGYRNVSLSRGGSYKSYHVHRLVAEAFIGPRPGGIGRPGGTGINHIDGNKLNNAASNLEYVTPAENSAHAVRTGLIITKGADNPAAKYTPDQIRHVHSLVSGGMTRGQASRETGIHLVTVKAVCSGRQWQCLGLEPCQ